MSAIEIVAILLFAHANPTLNNRQLAMKWLAGPRPVRSEYLMEAKRTLGAFKTGDTNE